MRWLFVEAGSVRRFPIHICLLIIIITRNIDIRGFQKFQKIAYVTSNFLFGCCFASSVFGRGFVGFLFVILFDYYTSFSMDRGIEDRINRIIAIVVVLFDEFMVTVG